MSIPYRHKRMLTRIGTLLAALFLIFTVTWLCWVVWLQRYVIYTDDGTIPTKPDSACAEDFCRRFDLEKERILMVGDTLTDVAFAKNAGISMIAVAKRKENRDLLLKHTDVVLPDVSYLEENIPHFKQYQK